MLSIAVQHHPSRADLVAELLAAVPSADLVVDPDPEGHRSAWRTYRYALELTPAGASHRLILQDDVIVCGGFEGAAAAACAARPGRVICFYVGGSPPGFARAVRHAASQGQPFAELDFKTWCPAVATAWPADLIGPLLAFVDAQSWPPAFTADDEIIGRFLRHQGVRPIATAPSLVDHPDDVESITRGRMRRSVNRSRVAACWIGNCDVSQIDWAAS